MSGVLALWGETNKFITTSASTSPSIPWYPFFTISSQTSPSLTLATSALKRLVPNACLPSAGSSSRIAFRIVRYRLQTLIRVVREALDIGASDFARSSGLVFSMSEEEDGVMTGRIVESDSGKRRVRKRVEAWRYVFEI